jgi:hypothetical protein
MNFFNQQSFERPQTFWVCVLSIRKSLTQIHCTLLPRILFYTHRQTERVESLSRTRHERTRIIKKKKNRFQVERMEIQSSRCVCTLTSVNVVCWVCTYATQVTAKSRLNGTSEDDAGLRRIHGWKWVGVGSAPKRWQLTVAPSSDRISQLLFFFFFFKDDRKKYRCTQRGRMKINLHTQKKTTNEDYVFLLRSRSMSIHRLPLPPLVYITILFIQSFTPGD